METKELIEWAEGEKPFFDKDVRDMLDNIRDRLVVAERMADALGTCQASGREQSFDTDLVWQALKQWEDLI